MNINDLPDDMHRHFIDHENRWTLYLRSRILFLSVWTPQLSGSYYQCTVARKLLIDEQGVRPEDLKIECEDTN